MIFVRSRTFSYKKYSNNIITTFGLVYWMLWNFVLLFERAVVCFFFDNFWIREIKIKRTQYFMDPQGLHIYQLIIPSRIIPNLVTIR